MLREDQTCQKCGALVTPQLSRCRQCGAYLHGSELEGFLVESLLPKELASSPGTSFLALYIILNYFLMVLLAGPESIMGFRPLALLQLGSTAPTEIYDLELWRFLSSVFAHGNIAHVLFNLYALSVVGPIVEGIHDRKRIIVFFVFIGALSMVGSHVFYDIFLDNPGYAGSVGASGAISGLIGVGWIASRLPGSDARDAQTLLGRWAFVSVLWGLAPGVDGAAHVVGLAGGALAGWLVSEGVPEYRFVQRFWTTSALLALFAIFGASALTLIEARAQPYRLRDDYWPRRALFFDIEPGAPWEESGQFQALKTCLIKAEEPQENKTQLSEALNACELAIRASPLSAAAHLKLAELLKENGNVRRAARQAFISRRLRRRFRRR